MVAVPAGADLAGRSHHISYYQKTREIEAQGLDPEKTDQVMLVRKRKSRIYFLRRFFDYPITLSKDTLQNWACAHHAHRDELHAGVLRPIGTSKTWNSFSSTASAGALPHVFSGYTEKVWGVPCDEISAEWGAQRVKGLSITKAISHYLRQAARKQADLAQKESETSLIEQFLYPKLGPGQMWEEVARQVKEMGGEILTGFLVSG